MFFINIFFTLSYHSLKFAFAPPEGGLERAREQQKDGMCNVPQRRYVYMHVALQHNTKTLSIIIMMPSTYEYIHFMRTKKNETNF